MVFLKYYVSVGLLLLLSGETFGQRYNYSEVIEKSLLFYEAQRSGRLPPSNRIPWRGDSMLQDGAEHGVDLTGGYHDAGDYVKFNFPQAAALSALALGAIDFRKGYENAGQLEEMREAIKWGADYFLKCSETENELWVQVGNATADHNSWDRPEAWTDPRPSYKVTKEAPGSDIAGEVAAFLAASSIIFKEVNASYSELLIGRATSLYAFAMNYTGKYSDSVPQATPFYTSYSYGDELAWAASWIYRATNESRYLEEAQRLYVDHNLQYQSGFSWDAKASGVDVNLARSTGGKVYLDALEGHCNYAVDSAPRTPKGLLFLSEWGSLRSAANTIFICLEAAELGLNVEKYRTFAREQFNLILGDWGRSFVVGFGKDPPQREHHRAASCPSPPEPCGWGVFDSTEPNPHILYGALVGGPDRADIYQDIRNDAVKNEVALDYNAAFQGAIAALNSLL